MPKQSPRSRAFLLLLLAIATGLLAMVIAPFAGGLFAAAVFAAVMHRLQGQLAAKMGDRPRLAALTLTTGLTLIVLVPLGWLTYVVVRQVADGVDQVVKVVEESGTEGLIEKLPEALQPLAQRVEHMLPPELLPNGPNPQPKDGPKDGNGTNSQTAPQSGVSLGPLLSNITAFARSMLVGLASLLIEVFVLVIALYFLLAEGDSLVRWIIQTTPLPNAQIKQFLSEFHEVTVAVFVSTISTAVMQASIAGIGYAIAGIPLFAMALLVTFVAACLPAIGGATIACGIAMLVLLSGDTGWGIFLMAWGVLLVGLADNLLRPLLAHKRAHLPSSVVFLSMLGGIACFGAMGVIAGPLVVSFFLIVVRALRTGEGTQEKAAQPA